MLQESLANAKASARLQCIYERKTSTANQRKEHNVEKCTLWIATVRVYVYLRSLAVVASPAKSLVILRKFELIAVQGHPRSSILVSIESPYATSSY